MLVLRPGYSWATVFCWRYVKGWIVMSSVLDSSNISNNLSWLNYSAAGNLARSKAFVSVG